MALLVYAVSGRSAHAQAADIRRVAVCQVRNFRFSYSSIGKLIARLLARLPTTARRVSTP